MAKNYLVIIGGPTAIGKTEMAIQLAKHFQTVIISADSRQIYKELNIGVAKPSIEQLIEVTHYFISSISIHQNYTAYDYQKDVHSLLPTLFQKHPIVIMTGGTGFYINAILKGLDEIPSVSQKTKIHIHQLYKEKGIQFLQEELQEKDPEYFAKVDIHNPVRLLRALEVIYETQKPFSYFLNNKKKNNNYFQPINLWINSSREILYQRINQRVDKMIEMGLEKEVRELYPYRHLNALNTVGYKEWWSYTENDNIDIQVITELIKRNTRHYAKRQITWFKHQWDAKEFYLSDISNSNTFFDELVSFVKSKIND